MVKRILVYLARIVVILASISCLIFLFLKLWHMYQVATDPQIPRFPTMGFAGDKVCNFDPSTVQNDMVQGKVEVFRHTPSTSEPDTVLPSGSLFWEQSEFLTLANAFHVFNWDEPLEKWQLYDIRFSINRCQDNVQGFDTAHFLYFKRGLTTYTAHGFVVYVQGGEITWGDAYYDRVVSWKSIDLNKFNVTADTALQIGESKGGTSARLKNHNECDIIINVVSDNEHDWDWMVRYRPTARDKYDSIFKIEINPYTGESEIQTSEFP